MSRKTDYKKLLSAVKVEEKQDIHKLHLSANEAAISNTASSQLSSSLANRYFLGQMEDGVESLGGLRMPGFSSLLEIECHAEQVLATMLGAACISLKPLSGVHAMIIALFVSSQPGDLVLSVPAQAGGHFVTKSIIEGIGRQHEYLPYDFESMSFDSEALRKMFKKRKPTTIYLDVSYYLHAHNLTEIRDAVGPDVVIIYDASHTLGLIAGGEFQQPFEEGADVICANTHKTFPGPHKGIIAFKDLDHGLAAKEHITWLVSTSHPEHLLALCITIFEMEVYGQEYAQQIITNSRALGKALSQLGYSIRETNTGTFSDNHQVHLLLDSISTPSSGSLLKSMKQFLPGNSMPVSSDTVFQLLSSNSICVSIDKPFEDGPFIRFGVQEVTRRGMKESDMDIVAELIELALSGKNVKNRVGKFVSQFSRVEYSFDE